MNKFVVLLLFLTFALALAVSNLYVLQTSFEEIQYPRYREEYAYNLKNPLLERYKGLAMDPSKDSFEE